MKKFSFLLLGLILILSGCGKKEVDVEVLNKDYKFCSLDWGDSWETVQKSDAFKDIEFEILRDNADMTGILAKEMDFYGFTVDALLSFGNKDFVDKGLFDVKVIYKQADEGNLLAKMIEIYGVPQNYFLDKNGIENPINPFGWYTKEYVETSLTEAAMEKYLEAAGNVEQSRLDALLRQPLVIINFDDEQNQIIFNGADAAVVREFNGQTK